MYTVAIDKVRSLYYYTSIDHGVLWPEIPHKNIIFGGVRARKRAPDTYILRIAFRHNKGIYPVVEFMCGKVKSICAGPFS